VNVVKQAFYGLDYIRLVYLNDIRNGYYKFENKVSCMLK